MASSCEVYGLEEKMSTQRISVSDHVNGFQYEAEESDSFVIDMESFSHGGNKEITANSRITVSSLPFFWNKIWFCFLFFCPLIAFFSFFFFFLEIITFLTPPSHRLLPIIMADSFLFFSFFYDRIFMRKPQIFYQSSINVFYSFFQWQIYWMEKKKKKKKLPRSFSRKGSLRGSDKKVNSNDRESGLASSSPRGIQLFFFLGFKLHFYILFTAKIIIHFPSSNWDDCYLSLCLLNWWLELWQLQRNWKQVAKSETS